jgi:hypothetical protein
VPVRAPINHPTNLGVGVSRSGSTVRRVRRRGAIFVVGVLTRPPALVGDGADASGDIPENAATRSGASSCGRVQVRLLEQ